MHSNCCCGMPHGTWPCSQASTDHRNHSQRTGRGQGRDRSGSSCELPGAWPCRSQLTRSAPTGSAHRLPGSPAPCPRQQFTSQLARPQKGKRRHPHPACPPPPPRGPVARCVCPGCAGCCQCRRSAPTRAGAAPEVCWDGSQQGMPAQLRPSMPAAGAHSGLPTDCNTPLPPKKTPHPTPHAPAIPACLHPMPWGKVVLKHACPLLNVHVQFGHHARQHSQRPVAGPSRQQVHS